MNFVNIVVYIADFVGTIAFAFSGAMVAIRYRMDLFGVLILAGFTSLGGGTIRDVLLGQTPPRMFTSYLYLLIAAVTAFVTFTIAYLLRGREMKNPDKLYDFINFIDAFGLGSFVVTGTSLPMISGYADNVFMCVFLGMTTGIGGGVLRDLMTRDIPVVLRKDVYAVAAIAGSLSYYLLVRYIPGSEPIATIVCVVVTVTLRMLATAYRWNLPRINYPKDMF